MLKKWIPPTATQFIVLRWESLNLYHWTQQSKSSGTLDSTFGKQLKLFPWVKASLQSNHEQLSACIKWDGADMNQLQSAESVTAQGRVRSCTSNLIFHESKQGSTLASSDSLLPLCMSKLELQTTVRAEKSPWGRWYQVWMEAICTMWEEAICFLSPAQDYEFLLRTKFFNCFAWQRPIVQKLWEVGWEKASIEGADDFAKMHCKSQWEQLSSESNFGAKTHWKLTSFSRLVSGHKFCTSSDHGGFGRSCTLFFSTILLEERKFMQDLSEANKCWPKDEDLTWNEWSKCILTTFHGVDDTHYVRPSEACVIIWRLCDITVWALEKVTIMYKTSLFEPLKRSQ